MNRLIKSLVMSTLALANVTTSLASDSLAWPDGRRVKVVQDNSQIDLSSLKSGVKGKVIDRRFITNDAMFLANEAYLSGTEFFLRASEKNLPVNDSEFSFLTNVEAYWYSRYNLMSLSARSRSGIGVIHGPYADLAAKNANQLNHFGQNRGELAFSNKDIMLSKVVGAYLERSGMPQTFQSAVPLMLEFKSADPLLLMPAVVKADATGRATYQNDYNGLQWHQDNMDTTIEMGGVAQSLLKKVLWAKFFLRRNHSDRDFPGEVFLGNNAEDGLRGSMLTMEAVSTMLMLKSSLFVKENENPSFFSFGSDRYQLTGINPIKYDVKAGFRYIPHEIEPTLIYMGDLPVRHFDLNIKDNTSSLWDNASWLWATTEFFDFTNPRKSDNWDRVFGFQTPYDGSIMEQKFSLLSQGLANTFLQNIKTMHRRNGVLVSTWSPTKGAGDEVQLSDLSLAMVALERYIDYMDLDKDGRELATEILKTQADFLIKAAAKDDSYTETIGIVSGKQIGVRNMTSQAFAVSGLLAAYHITQDAAYLTAAESTFAILNKDFWDSKNWLYRNTPDSIRVVYSPRDIAAVLAALREMLLVTEDEKMLLRFKRFFVQSIDVSGMQQAETTYTGENLKAIRNGEVDSDGDGIPFLGRGKNGVQIDSVFAAKVEFMLDKMTSPAITAGIVKTPTTIENFTGEQVYQKNCEICHGNQGIGNEGPRLVNNPFVQLTGKGAVMDTISRGRTSVGMPAWGNSLSKIEIEKVTEYIRQLGKDR